MTPTLPPPSESGALREMEDRLRARMSLLEDAQKRLRGRLRMVGLGLAAVVALLVAVAVEPSLVGAMRSGDVIDARGVRLVDAAGSVRGEWSVDPDGSTRLTLMDQQSRQRLNLSVLRTGFPGLALVNDAGQRRAVLGLLPDQTTTLVFADARGTPRAVLGLTNADAANLVFADSEGISRLGMGLDGDGMGSLIMPPDSAMATSPATPAPGGGQ